MDRGMKTIFTIIEIPEERKVNTGTFYLTRKVDIWWSISSFFSRCKSVDYYWDCCYLVLFYVTL